MEKRIYNLDEPIKETSMSCIELFKNEKAKPWTNNYKATFLRITNIPISRDEFWNVTKWEKITKTFYHWFYSEKDLQKDDIELRDISVICFIK